MYFRKSPHETFESRSDNDSQSNGKNHLYDAKAGDSTNQSSISMDSVRDRVSCSLYICKSLSGNESVKGVGNVRYHDVEFTNLKPDFKTPFASSVHSHEIELTSTN
jgi:hypothetical protein